MRIKYRQAIKESEEESARLEQSLRGRRKLPIGEECYGCSKVKKYQ